MTTTDTTALTVADHLDQADIPRGLLVPHLIAADFDVPLVAHFVVDGEPVPKARPRLGRNGRTYTPAKTRAAEDHIAWTFRQHAREHEPTTTDRYGLWVHWVSTKRGNVKDTDNLLKTLLDGLNRIAWVDDSHVREVLPRKSLTNDEPYTEALIYRIPNTDPPPRRASRKKTP